MKYKIWDRINERYRKTIFVDQNGDLYFYDDYFPFDWQYIFLYQF